MSSCRNALVAAASLLSLPPAFGQASPPPRTIFGQPIAAPSAAEIAVNRASSEWAKSRNALENHQRLLAEAKEKQKKTTPTWGATEEQIRALDARIAQLKKEIPNLQAKYDQDLKKWNEAREVAAREKSAKSNTPPATAALPPNVDQRGVAPKVAPPPQSGATPPSAPGGAQVEFAQRLKNTEAMLEQALARLKAYANDIAKIDNEIGRLRSEVAQLKAEASQVKK